MAREFSNSGSRQKPLNFRRMTETTTTRIADQLRDAAQPILGALDDYDSLMSLIGDARFVFLGEASHGTHEFYRERARISKRLIKEKVSQRSR
jgi:erythromycin esterase-like protein